MHAFYLHGAKDLRPADIDPPELSADQVLVRICATGICGSDLHYYEHGRNGDFVPARPFILGHESAGEVVDAGAFADSLPVGTRVAVDPAHPCKACTYCVDGRYNLCPQMRYYGSAASTPPFDGTFRQLAPALAAGCHPIPDDLDYRQAALLEPLAVALQAVKRADGVAGKRVLVCGAGPIGQLVGLVVRHYGAARTFVSDLRPSALALATDTWADGAVRADEPGQLAQVASAGIDLVIEASGAPSALRVAYECCSPGGTIVQLGTQPAEVSLPVNLVMAKELTLRGSFRFAHVFAQGLDLLTQQRIDLRPLITHRFALDDLVAGMETAASPDSIKVVVDY